MSGAIECPTCGGPASEAPVDPRAPLRCRWCGTSYERTTAETALKKLQTEIREWLQKTAGVPGGGGAASVDAATRTFIFNDRILPGLRRDVRRALDEEIGDVDGAPMLAPRLLQHMPGFRYDDALLISMRDAILKLRELRARLEADDVSAFATTGADRLALGALRLDIDRAILASNAACALGGGIARGAELARTNLAALKGGVGESKIEESNDPAGAALARAFKLRAEALLSVVSALGVSPPDRDALGAAAKKLEETGQWLLTTETRSLRTALASTGVYRDATAVRSIAAVAEGIRNSPLTVRATLDALGPLATCLSSCTRAKDAAALVNAWSSALAAIAGASSLPAIAETSWASGALAAMCKSGEQVVRSDVVLEPFWVYSARMTKAEGFFFVSGKQYEGVVLVPASASHEGTMLVARDHPMAAHVHHALTTPSRPAMAIDVAQIGPEAARFTAKAVLRAQNLKNVTLGEAYIVYVPVVLGVVAGAGGQRNVAAGPMGAVPVDAAAAKARARALSETASVANR